MLGLSSGSHRVAGKRNKPVQSPASTAAAIGAVVTRVQQTEQGSKRKGPQEPEASVGLQKFNNILEETKHSTGKASEDKAESKPASNGTG